MLDNKYLYVKINNTLAKIKYLKQIKPYKNLKHILIIQGSL